MASLTPNVVPLGLLAGSLALNVFLGLTVVRRADSASAAAAAGKFTLAKGDRVPALVGVALDGQPVTVTYGPDKPTLVYVVTPTCVWCVRNQANFDALVTQLRDRYRVVMLSFTTQGMPEYVRTIEKPWAGAPVTVVTAIPADLKRQMLLGPTPQTILVSARGLVEGVWVGAYDGPKHKEVEEALGVTLPGLQSPPAAAPSVLCVDPNGLSHSRGAVIDIDGRKQQCGSDGKWVPATRERLGGQT